MDSRRGMDVANKVVTRGSGEGKSVLVKVGIEKYFHAMLVLFCRKNSLQFLTVQTNRLTLHVAGIDW